jgi:nicotinate-nucleotide--dimethylbenzimidazole phosphoribosyltransferase
MSLRLLGVRKPAHHDAGKDCRGSGADLVFGELGFTTISPTDPAIRAAACRRLDSLTKPLGALGRLEPLAAQVCSIQRTLTPAITHSVAVVFAGDHGIADRGVSAYPRAVTEQMVKNFLTGGAAISVLARVQGADLWVVDAGVDADCEEYPRLIDAKIRRGTRDFVIEAAMTRHECLDALSRARAVIDRVVPRAGNMGCVTGGSTFRWIPRLGS